MGLATFMANDTYAPGATAAEVEDLLARINGVVDWRVHRRGYVSVKFLSDVTSTQLIESALAGVGLHLKHICDDPEASFEDAEQALSEL